MSEPLDQNNTFVDPVSTHSRGPKLTLLKLLGLIGILGMALAFFFPPVRSAGEAARRSQCKNNLKQIMLALHNYADDHKSYPPRYTVDANGRPLHSWRTLILPWLDQAPLFDKDFGHNLHYDKPEAYPTLTK